jgi:hypothetical protein
MKMNMGGIDRVVRMGATFRSCVGEVGRGDLGGSTD